MRASIWSPAFPPWREVDSPAPPLRAIILLLGAPRAKQENGVAAQGIGAGIAMVFSLLLAAVVWNLGTWLFGLPASSSHALIGSVLGVGLAASWGSAAGFGSGVNWAKAGQVLRRELDSLKQRLAAHGDLKHVPRDDRWPLRIEILRLRQAIIDYEVHHADTLSADARGILQRERRHLTRLTEYAPGWVPIGVALALGLGTMIGWKRIVVTVGEKIGEKPMSYAQGTSAQLVTAGTILAADVAGAPVSTTHILSSAVAGSMAAGGSGLQASTLRNIALAWVLTLPASLFLGAAFFLISRAFVG